MRTLILILTALAAAAPATAQAPADGERPDGWQIRLDRSSADLADVRFVTMGEGMHVTVGPPGIYYDPDTRASGEYRARATFVQTDRLPHPEAYGLLIGGRELSGSAQRYSYFLIRQDGRYLVKRRDGDETHVVMDWTEHPAVREATGSEPARNTLGIAVEGRMVRFLVNGREVARVARSEIDTDGVVGLRVNHRLDLHIDEFAVEPLRATSEGGS